MALSFPLGAPFPGGPLSGVWPAGWICLAPLIKGAIRAGSHRRAALGGLLAGGLSSAAILAWMFPFLRRWGMLSVPEAAAVFLLLIFYVSLYTAAFAFALRAWSGRWGASAALLLAPAAWTGLELGRGVLLTGFPWCLLG